MTAIDAPALLDREPELERFDALVDSLGQGEGDSIAIKGPPGIGKTSLLAALDGRARRAGVQVLHARGSELERSFAFGAVHQMLDARLRDESERDGLLAGAAALAEPVFAHHRSASVDEDGSYPVLHGLYWLVSNLAHESPVLLIVDDLQWVDEPSRRFVDFLRNRLNGMPVGVATAERDEEARPSGRRGGDSFLLVPRPLGADAVEEMIERAVGSEARPLAAACARASSGNPFLLVELLGEIGRGGVADLSEEDVERIAPESVRDFALERVAAIADGERVARAVAVLGDGASVDRVAALAELDVDRAGRVADELAVASILTVGRPLAFAHPIIRVAIHDATPRGLRSALHRHAAALAADGGDDARAIATHLLETDPAGDASAVARLVEVAAESVARGGPEPAVEMLRRALEEPPPARFVSLVNLDLGTQLAMLGDPSASDHLRTALAATDSDVDRVRISIALIDTLIHEGRTADALEVLTAARGSAPADEPELVGLLEARLMPLACSTASGRRLAGSQLAAVAVATEQDPDSASSATLAGVAFDAAVGEAADSERALGLARRALGDERLLRDALFVSGGVNALFLAGDFDGAEAVFRDLIGNAQARGRARDFAMHSGLRAWSRWLAGRLDGAEADALGSLDLAAESAWEMFFSLPTFVLASVAIERGDLDGAERVAETLEGRRDDADIGFSQLLHIASARMLAATGLHEQAIERLEPCRAFEAEWGPARGIRVVNAWRVPAAASLHALGRVEDALELAAEQLEAAEAFGAPRGIGEALRLGRLEPDPARAGNALSRAVDVLGGSGAELELAHAEVELGAFLRRDGSRSEARTVLEAGMDRAHRIGASAVATEAREELVLAGARPRRLARRGPDSLTASERRVARMAAGGMMNREIAQSLFVTLRTVEGHLSNAFRKLEIESRDELAGALEPEHAAGSQRPDAA
ncbi:AAA family ATPase [Thermoleophilia bacterium SCSIO 60948]|nr:AAA family ATPase [Thermoleophilia bacterium SCSIO 60948]